VFTTAFRIVRTSDLHPHTFIWPSLFFYVNAFTYAIFFLLGKIAELFPSRAEFQAYFILDPSPFVLIPRFTSAFFGTLSIFPLYLLGRALGQKKIGLLAAALLAVSPIHVEHAHFGTVDITLTFFTLCS